MQRLHLVFWLVLLSLYCAVSGARGADEACQKSYVVPYAEQCRFAYRSLQKNTAPANLSAAFDACGRAQNVAVSCVKTPDRHAHAIALGALFQDVTQQAEIAVFAQQFGVAKALLHEKLQIIEIVARDAKPGDPSVGRERAAAKIDLADAGAGLCMQMALAGEAASSGLARDRKFAALAALLKGKSGEYEACAKQAPTLSKRAYLEYVGLVALEESSRAAQAAGSIDDANAGYRACIARSKSITAYAKSPVTSFLATVKALCSGRMDGKYTVDQPAPMNAPATRGFQPLTLPKG